MSIYSSIEKAENDCVACALCTIIKSQGAVPRHTGSKMLVFEDRRIEGSIGGGEAEIQAIDEAIECLHSAKPTIATYHYNDNNKNSVGVCGGSIEVFIEPILGKPQLLVVGIGHVGKQVAWLGDYLGFNVTASDDRKLNWDEYNFSQNVSILNCKMSDISKKIRITNRTYIVITTRGNDIDIEGLPSLLEYDWAYLGVIGSKRRWQITKAGLLSAGRSVDILERIHSPIGLDIHAETPEEIAISIMAEIIQIKNYRQIKLKTVHNRKSNVE